MNKCESPISGTEDPVSGASGAVVVSIRTPETMDTADIVRTIYPALSGFTRYELSFSGGPIADGEFEWYWLNVYRRLRGYADAGQQRYAARAKL